MSDEKYTGDVIEVVEGKVIVYDWENAVSMGIITNINKSRKGGCVISYDVYSENASCINNSCNTNCVLNNSYTKSGAVYWCTCR